MGVVSGHFDVWTNTPILILTLYISTFVLSLLSLLSTETLIMLDILLETTIHPETFQLTLKNFKDLIACAVFHAV